MGSGSTGRNDILINAVRAVSVCITITFFEGGPYGQFACPLASEATGPDYEGVPALSLRGISKSFGAVRALTEVDLMSIPVSGGSGGDNGAGKSTLIKVMRASDRLIRGDLC